MSADAHTSVKMSFINHGQVRVLVLSFLTSNEGLNQQYNCQNSVMVEQVINYSMEHQGWLLAGRIGQQQVQHTARLVNLAMIDWLIENARWMKQSPMQYALRVLQNAASEDLDVRGSPLIEEGRTCSCQRVIYHVTDVMRCTKRLTQTFTSSPNLWSSAGLHKILVSIG